MPLLYAALLQATPENSVWELVKNVMLTLTTAGVFGLIGLMWRLRDDVRDLKRVVGINGKTGLSGTMDHHDDRLDDLEKRGIDYDAVTRIEKEQMRDRGRHAERLRDKFNPDIDT